MLNEALRFAVGPRPNPHQNYLQPRPSLRQLEKVANVLGQPLIISMEPLFEGGADFHYKCRLGLGPTTRVAHHYLSNEALRFAVGPRPNLHQNYIQQRPSLRQLEKVANVLGQQLIISTEPLFEAGADFQYKCRLGLGPTTRVAHHYLSNEALRLAVGPRPNLHQNYLQPPFIHSSKKPLISIKCKKT